MLFRRFYEFMKDVLPDQTDQIKQKAPEFFAQMDQAQRFVFSKSASEACGQLAENRVALRRASSQLFAPFPHTWIEQHEDDLSIGFKWTGEGEGTRKGRVLFCIWGAGRAQPILRTAMVDLDAESPLYMCDKMTEHYLKLGELQSSLDSYPVFFDYMLSAWALLATKGMTESVQPDLSKINKHRAAKGLYPLHSYTKITLNIDVERVVKARKAVATGTMPEHSVRAHLRFLRTGKVAIIPSHTRGNPAYGVRSHHYEVIRDEDRL